MADGTKRYTAELSQRLHLLALLHGGQMRSGVDADYYTVLLLDDAAATLVAYAASLGISRSGGDDLGIQCAETVIIRCD